MGLKISPNHTKRAILFAEDFLLVNPQLMSNPFQYSIICLNLPGTGEYKPEKALVLSSGSICQTSIYLIHLRG